MPLFPHRKVLRNKKAPQTVSARHDAREHLSIEAYHKLNRASAVSQFVGGDLIHRELSGLHQLYIPHIFSYLNEDIDFIKISENDRILGVLNLNNMIPIDNDSVKNLKYSEIEKYRNFKTNKEKSLYISLLNMELELINSRIEKIKANAFKLYNEKTNRPNSKISKRCCDFKVLEEKCRKYKRDY
jgi:hypothetical protein